MWENTAKFLESKTMVISQDAAQSWFSSNFFIIDYRQRDLTLGVFLIEIFALKKIRFFCKFWHWPTFSKPSVTRIRWPDTVQSFWWKLDENRLNGVGDIQRFSWFSRWHIFHWKIENINKLCGNLHSCHTFFKDLGYLDHNLQKNSN